MCQMAMGPLHVVTTWPIYIVNGYKFHVEEWSEGKKTKNSGVCVLGTGEGEFANDYYGVLKEVMSIEYPGEPIKKCVLFNCHWYDPTMNRGVRVHKDYGIVEIRHTRKYGRYDPFIFAYVATQVYYMPHPQKTRDKQDWWVVIRTKPRSRVDNRYTLDVAFQEENMSNVNVVADDGPVENLVDGEGTYEEVDINMISMSNQERNEDEVDADDNEEGDEIEEEELNDEEDDSDEDEEWKSDQDEDEDFDDNED